MLITANLYALYFLTPHIPDELTKYISTEPYTQRLKLVSDLTPIKIYVTYIQIGKKKTTLDLLINMKI